MTWNNNRSPVCTKITFSFRNICILMDFTECDTETFPLLLSNFNFQFSSRKCMKCTVNWAVHNCVRVKFEYVIKNILIPFLFPCHMESMCGTQTHPWQHLHGLWSSLKNILKMGRYISYSALLQGDNKLFIHWNFDCATLGLCTKNPLGMC